MPDRIKERIERRSFLASLERLEKPGTGLFCPTKRNVGAVQGRLLERGPRGLSAELLLAKPERGLSAACGSFAVIKASRAGSKAL